MHRLLFLPLIVGLLALGVSASGSDGGSAPKIPLDLPSGSGGTEEEEEDTESISFYGLEIEGQNFHFCFAAYEW